MRKIRLTKTQRQIMLTVALLAAMALVTWLTGLVGKATFITRSTGGSGVWAGIYGSLGDAVIYLAVLALGGPWGALVAAVGAALGDILLGASLRIIGSLIVKAGMAFFIGAFCRQCTSWKYCIRVAAVAELIMVAGYFIFDLLIMREFKVAALAIVVDLAQGVVCGALGALILHYVKPLAPEKLPEVKRRA